MIKLTYNEWQKTGYVVKNEKNLKKEMKRIYLYFWKSKS